MPKKPTPKPKSTKRPDQWNPGAQIIGNFDFDAKPKSTKRPY